MTALTWDCIKLNTTILSERSDRCFRKGIMKRKISKDEAHFKNIRIG
jgi:hypothetical protein